MWGSLLLFLYSVYLWIAKAEDGRNILYAVNANVKEGVATDKDLSKKESVAILQPSETINTTLSTESQDQSANEPKKSANEPKKFSMSDRVEETKDLVAVHNMTPDELLKSLQLGGLPMPSIAIIKAKSSHSEYGTVSLLFGKNTIFRLNPFDEENMIKCDPTCIALRVGSLRYSRLI